MEGKGANAAPEMASPTTLQTGSHFLSRLPEILDGRHQPGGSWRDTGRRHPTCPARAGTGAGDAEGGECARQAPGCLSRSGRGRHKTQAQLFVSRFCGTPEEPPAAQGTLHIEQPGA